MRTATPDERDLVRHLALNSPAFAKLSPRQREIFAPLVKGKGDKQIASELGLSPRTVENHVCRMRLKLGAATRGEIVYKVLAPLLHRTP